MIRAVVFDVGGILVELTGVPIFQSWIGNRLTSEEVWRRWLTSPAVRAFEAGRVSPEVFADALIDEFDLPLGPREFLSAFESWPRRIMPGAAELVRRVDNRYIRATLCNTNVLHWPRFLYEMGLGQLFERHFASHLIGKIKPDREMFDHALDALECDPSEMLFIDDQPLNVESARQAGIRAFVAKDVRRAERVLNEFGVLVPADASRLD